MNAGECPKLSKFSKIATLNGCRLGISDINFALRNRRSERLISQIAYKAGSAGRCHLGVNPAYTSQMCSSCGQLVPKDLSVRIHKCSCGYVADRDVNAAKNVKRLGLQSLEDLRSKAVDVLRSPHL